MKITRVDHVSFTVGELERSAAFYSRFGFEPFKRYVSAGPDVDEGTATENADMEIVWLKHPVGGPMLELIRYMNYPAERSALNSRVGAAHLCFATADIAAAEQELRSAGAQFLSAPHQDEFGMRWVYLRDPDGNVVELVQDPPTSTDATTQASAPAESERRLVGDPAVRL
jgi:catechol 2,3-dioxygenase-like lactoylglutathione lyase family enzyme